ncbi:transcriptional regulator GcvA [Agrobacterium larrymoorei]|uniref:Transcriptional regulator GcvA n=1 Tax=Agrobacterium larrymoorei TaxID=160699 RepID=A0AAF0KE81_9HYPH|nr:transcriptional regulator GcvA [Agrobacterium larrymoorei]WHA41803.1 transcriptional regulator GcvA [Agrobacterium larrymoorei]
MKMSRNFPLNAMRVFESAARHLSFTKAGDELGMTQTAVSYQIKLLEEFVGTSLFTRKPRQVSLTSTGERLAQQANAAFSILETAVAEARTQTSEVLIVSPTPTFAQQWLARRLGVFQARHPKIAVHLALSNDIVDFNRDNVDIGIRWGTGEWPGLIGHRIMRLDFAPVMSPLLLEKVGELKTPADLLKLTIISPNDVWWNHWFTEAGVDASELKERTGSSFGFQNLEAQAAMAGHGVAIVNPAHFAEDFAAGRLVQPFDLVCNDGRDYWLVYQESRRNIPKIKAFREWMLEEFPIEP